MLGNIREFGLALITLLFEQRELGLARITRTRPDSHYRRVECYRMPA